MPWIDNHRYTWPDRNFPCATWEYGRKGREKSPLPGSVRQTSRTRICITLKKLEEPQSSLNCLPLVDFLQTIYRLMNRDLVKTLCCVFLKTQSAFGHCSCIKINLLACFICCCWCFFLKSRQYLTPYSPLGGHQ